MSKAKIRVEMTKSADGRMSAAVRGTSPTEVDEARALVTQIAANLGREVEVTELPLETGSGWPLWLRVLALAASVGLLVWVVSSALR